MPIKGQPPKRLSRLGKIKVGEKTTSSSGKEIPISLDHFKAVGEFAKEFHDKYGDEPKRIKVCFPYPDIEENLSEWYRLYGTSGLKRICDGETAKVAKEGEFVEQSCVCDPENRECKATMNISVVVLGIPVTGVFNISTGGWNSRGNVRAALDYVSIMTDGKFQNVPFYLSVSVEETIIADRPFKYPVITCTPAIQTEQLLGHYEHEKQLPAKEEEDTTQLPKKEVAKENNETPEEIEPPNKGDLQVEAFAFMNRMNPEVWNRIYREMFGDLAKNEIRIDGWNKFIDRLETEIKANEN